jgi:hypothetical protein
LGIFDKLFRRNREADHEKWLSAHPGKGRVTMDAPSVSIEDEENTRARMEAELDAQRSRRESS